MNRLLRTRAALQSCDAHLKAQGGDASEIESFLAEYLAVTLCAEIQTVVRAIVGDHVRENSHGGTSRFGVAAFDKVFRSVGKAEIAGLLAMFCLPAKESFNAAADERLVTLYSNVVGNRHQIAHHGTATVTLNDIRTGLDAAEHLLCAFVDALPKCEEAVGVVSHLQSALK